MARALENVGELWRRAGLFQRLLLAGIVLGCVGAGVLLVNWARKPSMALLYSGLSVEEASGMVEKVRDAGSTYELRQGGTAVYVPEDKVYSLRLSLASAGLPAGQNQGYRILDQDTFGASPFTERVRYNRAIEGEIAKSVQTLEAVASARVHIVRPEATLFRSADKGASATVVVKLKSGHQLAGPQVAAIVHLVAGSVEGLSPDKVVVVDAQGSLLSGQMADPVGGRMASILDHKRQMEEYLARKAERHLALVLGPNRASVQVSVELDPNSVEVETRRYGPDKPVAVKETVKESKSTEPAAAKDTLGGTTTDSTTDTEYKVTETVERKLVPAGDIRGKTVSVIVDLTPPKAEARPGEAAPPAPKMLAIKDVEEVVKTALGMDEKNDKLTVKEATFYQPAEAAPVPDAGWLSKDFLLEVARRSSLGLLVIGALLALKMLGGRKKGAAGPAGAAALEAQAAQVGGLLPAGAIGLGDAGAELVKAQITRALQDNPEEVKRLFLTWAQNQKEEV